MGRLAVVILLPNVRLLALTQGAQGRCDGSSSGNTAGTEKGTDIWSKAQRDKSGEGGNPETARIKNTKKKKLPHCSSLAAHYNRITLTERLLLRPAQVVAGQQEAEGKTPSSRPPDPTVTAPQAPQGAYVQTAVSHHSHRQDAASCGTRRTHTGFTGFGHWCESRERLRNLM